MMLSRRVFSLVFGTLLLFGGSFAQAQNLVVNGNFESGMSEWSTWAATPSGFWNGVWLHSNDCVIWVPTNGCPYEGSVSHAQNKGSGAGNAHGGIYQTLSVVPGTTYEVSGLWSGGVTGNVDGNNGSWWEVVVFDGVVNDAIIDAGVRGPEDVLVAKQEMNNLANNEVYQFQWTPFSGSFVAESNTVTLAFKTGSYYTYDAAGYHDLVSVIATIPPPQPQPVPIFDSWAILLLILLLTTGAFLYRKRLN